MMSFETSDQSEARTNLIVNYLPQSLTDQEFKSMFEAFGELKSCKVIRDKSTGYSYGFGFADYSNAADALRAIDTINGMKLQNKTLKVAFARPAAEDIKKKGCNLYIANLPSTWTEDDLKSQFGQYGDIVQARVLKDGTSGQSKGVGFVLFDKKEHADAATQCLNGSMPSGATVPLIVKLALDKVSQAQAAGGSRGGYGRGAMTMGRGRGRGGAFGAAMATSYDQYNLGVGYQGGYSYGMGSPIGGGPMRGAGGSPARRYNPMSSATNGSGGAAGEGYTLFVYNIGTDADERTLWSLFAPFGTIVKVNIMYDKERSQCKGFGFVTMKDYTEAMQAVQQLNGYCFTKKPLQVSFKS